MIKYIIFDLGGVIVKSGVKISIGKMSTLLNLSDAEVYSCLGESSEYGSLYRLGKLKKEEFWRKTLSKWKRDYDFRKLNKIWVESYSVNRGMLPLLQKLVKNYKLGVLSNTVEDRFCYIDKQVKLKKYFSAMVLSFQDKVIKPDKKAFRLILQKLKAVPEESLYVDDKEKHAKIARSLGMKAIVYRNIDSFKKNLVDLGIRL